MAVVADGRFPTAEIAAVEEGDEAGVGGGGGEGGGEGEGERGEEAGELHGAAGRVQNWTVFVRVINRGSV